MRSFATDWLSPCSPPVAVLVGVLLERRGHEFAVALAQRRAEQGVGERQQCQRARDEDDGVPEGEAQEKARRKRPARGVGQPRST